MTAPIVKTLFGGLSIRDAHNLVDLIPLPGFTVFRDLLAARHRRSLETLARRVTTAEEALFERGILSVLMDVHEILVSLPTEYGKVLAEESTDGEVKRDTRSIERERGPE